MKRLFLIAGILLVSLFPLACQKTYTLGPLTIATPTPNSTPIPGSTWTARTLPSSQNWETVTYGNGEFVAVGYGSAVAATSPDGITWAAQTLPSSQYWQSVTYGNGEFVAVTDGPSAMAATSP